MIKNLIWKSDLRNTTMLIEQEIEQKLLKVQEKYFCAQKVLFEMAQDKKSTSVIMSREQIENLSRTGDIAQYLGKDYLPIQQFAQRLRMPTPPFLFVSRILSCTTYKNVDNLGSLKFEYDIPPDTLFQCAGRVHEFILAESCHALAFLAYFLLKEELLVAPSGLRGSNGKLCIYEEMPKPGETVRGLIEVKNIMSSVSGKILKIQYRCFYNEKQLFLLENYSAVIDPGKSSYINLPLPEKNCYSDELKTFNAEQVNNFFSGDFSKVFDQPNYENNSFIICHKMNKLLNRIQYNENGGSYRKGCVVGEYDLKSDHWIFASHFVGDPLFPASLMGFGMFQLLVFYAIAVGLYPSQGDFYPTQCKNVALSRKLINPIYPGNLMIYFRLELIHIEVEPMPKLLARGVLFSDEYIYAEFENFGIEFKEQNEH